MSNFILGPLIQLVSLLAIQVLSKISLNECNVCIRYTELKKGKAIAIVQQNCKSNYTLISMD